MRETGAANRAEALLSRRHASDLASTAVPVANFVGVGGILLSIVQYPVAVVVGHFLLLSVAKYNPFAQI